MNPDFLRQPVFEVEGRTKDGVVGAQVRITVDAMKATIVQHVTAMFSQNMPEVIEAAVKKALDDRNWEQEIAACAKDAMDKLIKGCVEEAVTYNYDLKVLVKKQINDALSKITT